MEEAIDDPILGPLTWHEDEDEAELAGVASTPSGQSVGVGIEVRRDEDDRRPPVDELLDQAGRLFVAICEREGSICAAATDWLAAVVRMDTKAVRERVRWTRVWFSLDGYAQMVYDISELQWGRREMFVDVGPGGQPIEGRLALL
jgi:hypothetical protein